MERAALRISKPSDTGCNFFQCLFALQKKKEREEEKIVTCGDSPGILKELVQTFVERMC